TSGLVKPRGRRSGPASTARPTRPCGFSPASILAGMSLFRTFCSSAMLSIRNGAWSAWKLLIPTVSNAREALIPRGASPFCTSLMRPVSQRGSSPRQWLLILIWSVPCDSLLTASANGWALEMSPSPSASVSTVVRASRLPALFTPPEPHAAAPIANAAASTIHARPRKCVPFIATSFRLGSSLAASPPVAHRGQLAFSHPRRGFTPMGIWTPTCHDAVVGGLRRAIAAVHTGDLSLSAIGGRLGLAPLAAIGVAFGFASLAEARSAPGGSFAGTSTLAAVAELAAGWSLIAAGVVESRRRRARRAGLLLAGAGIGWFFAEWNNPGVGSPVAFTFGLI